MRANDTDITINLSENINLFSCEVWYQSGLYYNNTREYLSITKLNLTMENPKTWIDFTHFWLMTIHPHSMGKEKCDP